MCPKHSSRSICDTHVCPSTNCWYFRDFRVEHVQEVMLVDGLGVKTCRLHLPSLGNHLHANFSLYTCNLIKVI